MSSIAKQRRLVLSAPTSVEPEPPNGSKQTSQARALDGNPLWQQVWRRVALLGKVTEATPIEATRAVLRAAWRTGPF